MTARILLLPCLATTIALSAASPLIAQTVTFIDSFGTVGSENGQFINPFFITANPADGRIYVSDNVNNDVEIFTSTGTSAGQFDAFTPRGVAVLHSTGEVYVCINGGNLVGRFNSGGGASTLTFGVAGTGNGQFDGPRGLAINQTNGDIWVGDVGNSRLQRFSSTGVYLGQFGSAGTGNGQFNSPSGIAIHPVTGDIYVVDTGNDRVQRFSSAGTYLGQWGTSGSGDGQFLLPYGITIDDAGRVYVSDGDQNRIQRFSSLGTFQLAFGATGDGAGQLSNPRGITLLPGNVVAVVDATNRRVSRWQIFDPVPPAVRALGRKRFTTGTALTILKGTAADANGDLAGVEVKVGKGPYKSARGNSVWSFRARLKFGKNVILVRARDETGLYSITTKLTVTRRAAQ